MEVVVPVFSMYLHWFKVWSLVENVVDIMVSMSSIYLHWCKVGTFVETCELMWFQ